MVKNEGFKTDKNLLNQLSKIITADDFAGDKWVGGNINKKCLEINYWKGKDKILKTKKIRLQNR
jgi:hypothetical protein